MVSSPSATTATPSPRAQVRIIALEPDHVAISVTTRHLFGLQQVRASVRLISGEVRLDASGALVSMEAELDAASFSSGSRSRDAAVASARLLHAAQHPRLVFRSTGPTAAAYGATRVRGTLTARGVTSPTTLVVRPDTAARNTATATARIDRFTHGITAGRGLASRYLDVVITVTLEH